MKRKNETKFPHTYLLLMYKVKSLVIIILMTLHCFDCKMDYNWRGISGVVSGFSCWLLGGWLGRYWPLDVIKYWSKDI